MKQESKKKKKLSRKGAKGWIVGEEDGRCLQLACQRRPF